MAPTQVSESEFVKQWSRWTGIGHAGHWKTSFAPPHFPGGDSRCPCPALNAMANHGILPRNGRRITPDMLISRLARTYNLAPTIAAQLLFPFKVLYEDRGWFDLEDIGAQGLVQHDGSLLREDNNSEYAAATNVANQASPSQRLINRYFPESMDPFDWHDHARVLSYRRRESRETNGAFVLNAPLQYIFGAGNAALTHRVIGGRMRQLRPWLGAQGPSPLQDPFDRGFERFVDGFVPRDRSAWGITILQAQVWTLLMEGRAGSLGGLKRMDGCRDGLDATDGWNAGLGIAGREFDPTGTSGG